MRERGCVTFGVETTRRPPGRNRAKRLRSARDGSATCSRVSIVQTPSNVPGSIPLGSDVAATSHSTMGTPPPNDEASRSAAMTS